MQRLSVTLPPSQMSSLATSQVIIDKFPDLQELVMQLPLNSCLAELYPLSNLLSSRGVASCISNHVHTMYSSPSPMSADLFERGLQGNRSIFLRQSLHQDLSNILHLATNAGVDYVKVTKFIGFGEVEESLKKLVGFSIVREAGDSEDVMEEEVKAANQLLDLLADCDRKGRLERVYLHKVDFREHVESF